MKLEYILKLMEQAAARLEDGHINHTALTINDAIEELKKIIEDGKSTMGVDNVREDKDIVTLLPCILNDINELEFWKQAYIAALNSRYTVLPEIIADATIIKIRERGVKVL